MTTINEYLFDADGLSTAIILEKIKNVKGLPLCDMKVSDLIFYNKEPIYRGCGVYVFKLKDEIVYVGSCVSRSFVERIPSHFDIRGVGWFNSLLRTIRKSILKKDVPRKDDAFLLDAARFAMSHMTVVLVNFIEVNSRELITRLEHELIDIFKTKNRKPSLKIFNLVVES